MEQLVMKAAAPHAGRMGVLPEGYRFVPFGGSAEDVADWKRISWNRRRHRMVRIPVTI